MAGGLRVCAVAFPPGPRGSLSIQIQDIALSKVRTSIANYWWSVIDRSTLNSSNTSRAGRCRVWLVGLSVYKSESAQCGE